MLNEYKIHVQERADQNIPPLPLDADQTSQLVELLKSEHDESDMLLHLLKERVPAGVDQSAYVKAAFLADITTGEASRLEPMTLSVRCTSNAAVTARLA